MILTMWQASNQKAQHEVYALACTNHNNNIVRFRI